MNTTPIIVGFTSGFVVALLTLVVLALANTTVTWRFRIGIILLSAAIGGLTHHSFERYR